MYELNIINDTLTNLFEIQIKRKWEIWWGLQWSHKGCYVDVKYSVCRKVEVDVVMRDDWP